MKRLIISLFVFLFMEKTRKDIIMRVWFGGRKLTLDSLISVHNDLVKLADIPPENEECTCRIVDASIQGEYSVEEYVGIGDNNEKSDLYLRRQLGDTILYRREMGKIVKVID